MPWMIGEQPGVEWHWVWRAFIAWAAVDLAGTARPSPRRTSPIGLRMTNTVCPTSGLVPEKEESSRTRKSARRPAEPAEVSVGIGGAVGVAAEAAASAGVE